MIFFLAIGWIIHFLLFTPAQLTSEEISWAEILINDAVWCAMRTCYHRQIESVNVRFDRSVKFSSARDIFDIIFGCKWYSLLFESMVDAGDLHSKYSKYRLTLRLSFFCIR